MLGLIMIDGVVSVICITLLLLFSYIYHTC